MEMTLGQILLGKNIISQTQLDLALRRQKQQKGKYLGQILVEMGISQEKINQILDSCNKRKRLGEILVDLKIITSHQLEMALQKQKDLLRNAARKPLGSLVLELGFTQYDNYLRALAGHFNMPILSLESFYPSPQMQKILGEKYTHRNRIVVLYNDREKIKIALAEPTHHLLEEIKKALPAGKKTEFYLANPYEVDSCLRRKFDPFALTRYR